MTNGWHVCSDDFHCHHTCIFDISYIYTIIIVITIFFVMAIDVCNFSDERLFFMVVGTRCYYFRSDFIDSYMYIHIIGHYYSEKKDSEQDQIVVNHVCLGCATIKAIVVERIANSLPLPLKSSFLKIMIENL